jgi:hypothetical protein
MNQFHEGMSRVRRAILVFAAFFPLTFLSRAIFGKQAILPDVLLIGAFFTLAYVMILVRRYYRCPHCDGTRLGGGRGIALYPQRCQSCNADLRP